MNVKLKYVALAVLLSLVGFSYGQNLNLGHILLEKDTVGVITKTIIRGYNKSSILYMEKGGKHYFSAMTYASPDTGHNFNLVKLRNVEIDQSYCVNDFKIVGSDLLYFCGELKRNGISCGFIGFFNIEEFLSGNNALDIKVQDNFVQAMNYRQVKVTKFTKMETFESEGFHVVAIGATDDSRSCVVEMLTDGEGSVNGIYKLGISTNVSEVFNDIAVTDNYVVTVGSCNSEPYAAIRRYLKQDIFSSTGDQNIAYRYPPLVTDGTTEYLADDLNDILITDIEGDNVAIVSHWYNSFGSTGGQYLSGTLLRVYDVASSPDPLMLVSVSIDQDYYAGKWKLKEFEYNPNFQTFALLQNMEESPNPNSLVNLFSIITLGNNSLVESISYTGIELTSFDNCFSSVYNILSGYEISNPKKLIFIGDKMNNSNKCYGNNLNLNLTFKVCYASKLVRDGFSNSVDNLLFNVESLTNFSSQYMDLSCKK